MKYSTIKLEEIGGNQLNWRKFGVLIFFFLVYLNEEKYLKAICKNFNIYSRSF